MDRERHLDRERRAELLNSYEGVTELPLMALALAIIPLLLAPLLVSVSGTLDATFMVLDFTIVAVFAVDLCIRTYLSDRRLMYLVHHWYDVLLVAMPFARPLRVLRSARILRMLRLGPVLARVDVGARHLLRRRGLQYILVVGVVTVFASAGLVTVLEHGRHGTINNYGDALWWASTTVTTVAYGDTFPVTAEGRAVAVFLMLVGIAFFSWLTAHIAAFLVEFGGEHGRTVTMADLMDKLESLEREVQALRRTG